MCSGPVADAEQRAAALGRVHAELHRQAGRPVDVAVVAQHAEAERRVEVERAFEVRRVDGEVEDRLQVPVSTVGHVGPLPMSRRSVQRAPRLARGAGERPRRSRSGCALPGSRRARQRQGRSADGLQGVDLALAVPGVVADAALSTSGVLRCRRREEGVGRHVRRAGDRVGRVLQARLRARAGACRWRWRSAPPRRRRAARPSTCPAGSSRSRRRRRRRAAPAGR